MCGIFFFSIVIFRVNFFLLQVTIFAILSAVSGISKETLFSKIDFVMTDSTAHNMEVEKLLAHELDVDHVPNHLLCQVHPVFMFVRELDSVFKTIEQTIGPQKVFASFNVTPNSQESITTQFLDCGMRLVAHDFDHKPWNKANEFDIFIEPKKNLSIRLASERFTRYTYLCAAMLHHDKDICAFLRKFDHVTNNLACIVRCFEDVEFLRVLCLVGALIGLHLVEPFVKITSSAKTTYADLKTIAPTLYDNFLNTDVNAFFQVTKPALSFASPEVFDAVKYDEPILSSITSACAVYKSQVRDNKSHYID